MISKSPQANNQAYTFLRNSLSQCSKSSKSKRAITPIKWSDETAAKYAILCMVKSKHGMFSGIPF